MIEYEIIIGLVKNGNFYTRSLEPEISAPTFLTEIKGIESIPPETRKLNLTEYEEKAITVQGHNQGGVIYEVAVIDVAGPILTVIVQKLFGD